MTAGPIGHFDFGFLEAKKRKKSLSLQNKEQDSQGLCIIGQVRSVSYQKCYALHVVIERFSPLDATCSRIRGLGQIRLTKRGLRIDSMLDFGSEIQSIP